MATAQWEEPPGEGSPAEGMSSQEQRRLLLICQCKCPAPKSPIHAGVEEKWILVSHVCYFLCCSLGSSLSQVRQSPYPSAFNTITNCSWLVLRFHEGTDTVLSTVDTYYLAYSFRKWTRLMCRSAMTQRVELSRPALCAQSAFKPHLLTSNLTCQATLFHVIYYGLPVPGWILLFQNLA